MTTMYGILDIDPTTYKVLGTTVQGNIIESSDSVLIESPVFGDEGVEGFIISGDDKRKLRGLKRVVRNDDGAIYTFDGRMPLLNAAYALINPRNNTISYTNVR